jgi:hypothetical protein
MFVLRLASMVLLLVVAIPETHAADAKCTGTVSGAAKGSFTCKAQAARRGDGSIRLTISPLKLPKAIKAFAPGDFNLAAPVKTGVHTLDQIESSKILITVSEHRTYVAGKGKKKDAPRNGSVTLTIKTFDLGPPEGNPSVTGTLNATLVPAKDEKGEIVVNLSFDAR